MLHMAEGSRPERKDRRADLRVRDDLDAEDIGQSWAAVITKSAEDEVLALLIEYENSGEHFSS